MPRTSIVRVLSGALLCSLLLSGLAMGQAGGLFLPENGGPINGTAQAGSAAVARGADTAWLNPAGMTRLDSAEVMLGLQPTLLSMQFNPSSETSILGSDGGDQGGWVPLGSMYLAVPVSEVVALGFSVTAPAGLVIDPDDNWVGRGWTTESALALLNFEPSVGVRLGEHWSLGAGLDLQYLAFKQDLSGPTGNTTVGIDGDSWDLGFSLSAMWEPSETTRLGLRYHSEVGHELSGDMTLTAGARPISTSFTIPMSATLSAYHDVSDRFALMLDLGWTDWSAFDYNEISFDASGAAIELPRNFKDTWNVSLGSHIRLSEDWLLMLGLGYVTSAVDDANRTPDLPVDQQVRGSAGLEWQISEAWKAGLNYTYAWLGDNSIDQTRPVNRRIAGDYDSHVHIIGLYAGLAF